MKKLHFKSFLSGFLVCCLVLGTTVFASGTTKNIKALFNAVTVKLDGKVISGENIKYNNNVYINSKNLASFLGKQHTVDNNGNVSIYTKPKKAPVTISDEGFTTVDEITYYYVIFSDGVSIYMSTEVSTGDPMYGAANEAVVVSVRYKDMAAIPANITIKGFSKTFDETYLSIPVSNYANKACSISEYKKVDFFEYKKTTTTGEITGLIVFNSFENLEGIKYNDGIHICELYVKDLTNRNLG